MTLYRHLQRCMAFRVLSLDISPQIQQQIDTSYPARTTMVQGRSLIQVTGINVCALLHQPPDQIIGAIIKTKRRTFTVAPSGFELAHIEHCDQLGKWSIPQQLIKILRECLSFTLTHRGSHHPDKKVFHHRTTSFLVTAIFTDVGHATRYSIAYGLFQRIMQRSTIEQLLSQPLNML